ncbi:phosphatase, partial [Neisseria meningitidis]
PDRHTQRAPSKKQQQACAKQSGDGLSCPAPHAWGALEDCVSAVNGAGGMAVISPPMRYDLSASARRNLFEEFKSLGGAGIEVHSGSCCKNDRLSYALLAERFG